MTTDQIIALVVALILWAPLSVFLTQAIKRCGWPDGVKAVLALVCATIVGLAGTWVTGDLLGLIGDWGTLTATQIIAYVGIVNAAATIWYKTYFGGTSYMKSLGNWPSAE